MNSNQTVHEQQSFLRQKRNQFANQIRRNQRKQIIRERRKKCFPQLMNVQPQQHMTKDDFKELLRTFQDNKQNQQSEILYKIHKQLTNPNSNYTFLTSLLFQYGTYCILLQNLNLGRYLKQTLSIFSFIFSKENLRYGHLLVSKGILQNLLQILPLNIELIPLVLNIIRNICIEHDDFCQIILQTNKFEDLINIFYNIYNNQPDKDDLSNSRKILESIIDILDVLVSMEQSNLDFQSQYDYILNFFNDLLRQNICVKSSLAAIYSLALKNSVKVQAVVFSTINQLLHDQTGQSPYYQNLLLVVSKLTPGRFNYQYIFQISLKAQYDNLKYTLSILDKVVDTQHADYVKKNQFWLEKILIRIDHQKPEFKLIISIIRKLQINFPCIWRFLSNYLDDIYDNQTTLQIIIFIKSSFLSAMQSKDSALQSFLAEIQRNRIQNYLLKIYQKNNFTYASKAQQLIYLLDKLKKKLSMILHH